MQQALVLIFLAFLLLGQTTSFAQPDEEDETEDEIPSTHVPHLISSSLDFIATVGESVTFPCDVDDLRDFVLLWSVEKDKKSQVLFAGNLVILRDQPRFSLSGTSLKVQGIQAEDSGVYICHLGTSPPTQLNHTLDVHYPPSIEAYPKDAFITAKEGESITLTCHAKGNPKPIVTWKHAGKHYDSNGKESYTINNAQKDDSGNYECIADNQVGDPASAVITLDIVSAPKVSTEPENGLLVVKEGEPISIGCKATGDPMPHITWKKPQSGEKMKSNKILVSKASLSDAGAYECIANNSLGIYTSAIIRVQVMYAPKVQMSHSRIHAREGARVNITCIVEGEPSPTVTWMKGGSSLSLSSEHYHLRGHSHTLLFHHLREEDFGMYECVAINSLSSAVGKTNLIGTPQVPSIMSKPHGTQGTKYTVSWTVNSHTPIDEYSLTYRKLGETEWQSQSVPSIPLKAEEEEGVHMQMFQLSDLQPSTEYEAVVRARNKFGWSDDSQALLFTTKSEEKHSETLSSGSCISSAGISMLFLLVTLCTRYAH